MGSAERQLDAGATRARGGGFAAVMAATPPSAADPVVPLSVRVRQSLRRRLRVACLQNDRTVQEAVDEAVEAWLAQHERR